MPDRGPKITGSTVRTVCEWLEDKSLPASSMAMAVGMEPEQLAQPDCRVDLQKFHALLDQAASALGDQAVGLDIGSWDDTSRMGVIGHILFNNRTLGDALVQYQRLSTLINEGVEVSSERIAEDVVVLYRCPDGENYHPVNLERMLAQAVTRAQRFIGQRIRLSSVGFAHACRGDLKRYADIFRCEVHFSQPCCHLAFAQRYLSFELPRRNPYLHQALTRQIEILLRRLKGKRRISVEVRRIIERALPKGDVDIMVAAERLAMSRQTLYRKLKQENVSFQELVEEVRKEKAKLYLNSGKYSLGEIAFLLGFSEQSAFSRAFKRWTGRSPAQYRDDRA